MALISVDKDARTFLEYGRQSKGRRWYLSMVCRETGRRYKYKFVTKPTRKQIRKSCNFLRHTIKFDLYWDAI